MKDRNKVTQNLNNKAILKLLLVKLYPNRITSKGLNADDSLQRHGCRDNVLRYCYVLRRLFQFFFCSPLQRDRDPLKMFHVLVVCNHSREIQITKTLAAMLDDRNNKAH